MTESIFQKLLSDDREIDEPEVLLLAFFDEQRYVVLDFAGQFFSWWNDSSPNGVTGEDHGLDIRFDKETPPDYGIWILEARIDSREHECRESGHIETDYFVRGDLKKATSTQLERYQSLYSPPFWAEWPDEGAGVDRIKGSSPNGMVQVNFNIYYEGYDTYETLAVRYWPSVPRRGDTVYLPNLGQKFEVVDTPHWGGWCRSGDRR